MVIDDVEIVNVNVPDLSEQEIRRYLQMTTKPLRVLTIIRRSDGKIQLDYETKKPKFERIRRITGYLVGAIDQWNDAKRAEERERVKHNGQSGMASFC